MLSTHRISNLRIETRKVRTNFYNKFKFLNNQLFRFRTEYDDSYAYCATVKYSPKTGYRIEYWGRQNDFKKIKMGCARACYKDQHAQSGLAFLEIETQTGYKSQHQAHAAGLAEGTLTWMSIYAQYTNTIVAFCDSNEKFCDWLREVVLSNFQNVYHLAKEKQETDQFHHMVYLYYQQLLGVEAGFKRGVRRSRLDYEIPTVDFLLLNAKAEIEDLKVYYNNFVAENEEDKIKTLKQLGKMIVKILPGLESVHPKLLLGHTSSGEYGSMLKIVKTYRFNFHYEPKQLVTNTDITFTSQPGAIASSDDFYLAHGKRTSVIVAGLPLKRRQHFDAATLLYGYDIEGSIFASPRTIASIRISKNGSEFAKNMKFDADIGVKQWLVIDEKRLKFFKKEQLSDDESLVELTASTTELMENLNKNDIPKEHLESGLKKANASNRNIIWLVEQTFRRIYSEDITTRLSTDLTAWIFDGSPIFDKIKDFNDLHRDSVRLPENVIDDLESIEDYLIDKSYRGDLQEDPELFGNIDLKLYTSDDHTLLVQSGPLDKDEEIESFDWTDHDDMDIKHEKQPDEWNFSPVKVDFFWE